MGKKKGLPQLPRAQKKAECICYGWRRDAGFARARFVRCEKGRGETKAGNIFYGRRGADPPGGGEGGISGCSREDRRLKSSVP